MLNIKEALFGRLRGMHHVNRYSSVPLIHAENVAEHSWQVAMLSYLIGLDLRGRGVTIAMEQLLRQAIVHDLDECMSGDIIRSFKYVHPEVTRAIKEANHMQVTNLTRMFGDEGIGLPVFEDWKDAKSGLLEGQIVALADMLCVVSKCVSEYRMGNRQVNYILRAMYEENLAEFHQSKFLGRYVDAIFPDRRWFDALTDPAN